MSLIVAENGPTEAPYSSGYSEEVRTNSLRTSLKSHEFIDIFSFLYEAVDGRIALPEKTTSRVGHLA